MDKQIVQNKTVARALVDPVCGMIVPPGKIELVSLYNRKSYYFCAETCKKAFEKNPERYLKPKGVFGRFLERLARSNQEEFGTRGPSCCP